MHGGASGAGGLLTNAHLGNMMEGLGVGLIGCLAGGGQSGNAGHIGARFPATFQKVKGPSA